MILTIASQYFSIPITPTLIFSLYGLLIAAWITFSVIIRYHWKNYGASNIERMKMDLIYYVGSGILFVFAGIYAILYATL